MVMDDYDIVNEKPEVAIITPDDATPDAESLADDCRCISLRYAECISDKDLLYR